MHGYDGAHLCTGRLRRRLTRRALSECSRLSRDSSPRADQLSSCHEFSSGTLPAAELNWRECGALLRGHGHDHDHAPRVRWMLRLRLRLTASTLSQRRNPKRPARKHGDRDHCPAAERWGRLPGRAGGLRSHFRQHRGHAGRARVGHRTGQHNKPLPAPARAVPTRAARSAGGARAADRLLGLASWRMAVPRLWSDAGLAVCAASRAHGTRHTARCTKPGGTPLLAAQALGASSSGGSTRHSRRLLNPTHLPVSITPHTTSGALLLLRCAIQGTCASIRLCPLPCLPPCALASFALCWCRLV